MEWEPWAAENDVLGKVPARWKVPDTGSREVLNNEYLVGSGGFRAERGAFGDSRYKWSKSTQEE